MRVQANSERWSLAGNRRKRWQGRSATRRTRRDAFGQRFIVGRNARQAGAGAGTGARCGGRVADGRHGREGAESFDHFFELLGFVDDGAKQAGAVAQRAVERARIEHDAPDGAEPQKLVRQIGAAAVGQIEVENAHLEARTGGPRGPAGLREADRVPFAEQATGDRPSDDRIVLHNQRSLGLRRGHQSLSCSERARRYQLSARLNRCTVKTVNSVTTSKS